MSFEGILEAHKRIINYIHKTPVVSSTILDEICGRSVFLKCELLQKTGSFKARGALNAILKHKQDDPKSKGVVTHSSGNHGQAVAWAARMAHLPCTVVVPNNTPAIKCEAIKSYGAKLVFCEPSPESRFHTCDAIAASEGKYIVPPYDHRDVISGQGTMAVELLDEISDLDAIFVPISGGGMTSGIAIATKSISPKTKVFGVEPYGKELEPCLRSGRFRDGFDYIVHFHINTTKGKRLWPDPPRFVDTIAEGIRTQQCGKMTFPILCDLIEKDVFTVTDDDMIKGMKFSMQYLKLVIEASSGAGIAAVMSEKMKQMDPGLKRIGVILCGGNVDIEHLPWYT